MAHWAGFYERIFNFREIRYFDIKGEYTGLTSKAMTAPDGKIRIPLNEEGRQGGRARSRSTCARSTAKASSTSRSSCDDLLRDLRPPGSAGHAFAPPPPDTYYEMLEGRLPGHGEPVRRAAEARHPARRHRPRTAIPACCCRSSAAAMIGPVFFEFIQRKRDEGFGEGNFTALFKSLEEDQLRRGTLQPDEAEG